MPGDFGKGQVWIGLGVPVAGDERGVLLWIEEEENRSARNSPSWVECLYPQLVCQLLKSLTYTAGAGESGNEHCSSLLGGGL